MRSLRSSSGRRGEGNGAGSAGAAISAAVHLGLDVVIAHVDSFTEKERAENAVAAAHAARLQVGAWCPDRDQAALVAAGVDCLIVDRFGAG